MVKKCLAVLMAVIMCITLLPANVSIYAEETNLSVVSTDENIKTGTLGDNNGFQWTYDESTKTLTVTGEDSGLIGQGYSPLFSICYDVETIVFQDCTFIGSVAWLCGELHSLKDVRFLSCDTSQVTNMRGMFYECINLESVNLSEFNTSNVTDMQEMFFNCNKVNNLDVSGFDTSKVMHMWGIFYGCSSLQSIDVSRFDTSNVTDMTSLFFKCSSLKSIDVSGFDTSKATSMSSMFVECTGLTELDVSGFDTSNVTRMGNMFLRCSNLKSLDVSGFDTSNVTNIGSMFYGCKNLSSLDVSGFNTSKVQEIGGMFGECSNIKTLDLSNFDMSNVNEHASSMLYGCDNLKTIHTPKTIPNGISISLPYTFYDAQKNSVTKLTNSNCNTYLSIDGSFDDKEDDSGNSDDENNNNDNSSVVNKYQYFEGGISWYEAKEKCEELGGHLLVISSAEEQAYINSYIEELRKKGELTKQNIWIGATISNGVLNWVGDENSTYTNWASGEPNNVYNSQDCVMMYTALSVNGNLGYWNDENGNGREWEGFTLNDTGYICEWDVEGEDEEGKDDENNPSNTNKYQYFEGGVSWYEAKKKCEELGGHLLVISSAEEQAYINSYVKELHQAGKLTKRNIWLGATINNGVVTWVNGEKSSYTNWASGEPNNYGGVENCIMMYTPLSEGNLGFWNDESGYGRDDGGAYTLSTMGYICEWDTDYKQEDGFNFYLNYPTNCISVGTKVDLHVGYYLDGKVDSNTNKYIYTVEDSSVIDIVDNGWSDKYGQKLIVKGKKAGNTVITVTNPTNGKSETIPIYVSNESGWTFDNVPKMTIEDGKVTNFYNYSGMVVDEFSYVEHKDENGNIDYYVVTMNVYNSENLYGAVTSHYSDGGLAYYKIIDKKTNYDESFVESLKSLYFNCGDFYYLLKNEYYYSGKATTKETKVSIEVPVGGYLTISNNVMVSDVAHIANCCGGIYDMVEILSDISKFEYYEEIFVEVKLAILQEVIDEVIKKQALDCLTKASYEMVNDFDLNHDSPLEAYIYISKKVHDFALIDLISMIEEKINLKLEGESLGESIVTKVLPTGWIIEGMYTITKILDFATFYSQYSKSSERGAGIFIYAPATNLEHQSNGVIVDMPSDLDNTIVHAYLVADTKVAGIDSGTFSDEVIYYSEKYQTYSITLYDNGVESQPQETVTVKIPIPKNFNRDSLKVYRNNEDGSLTDMNAYVVEDYIVFETPHFSYYSLVDESSAVLSSELTFAGASLTLQDNLVINYKVDKNLIESGYSNPYIKFVFNNKETVIKNYRIIDDKYVFDFTDIAPNKMNDTIYATLYAEKDGIICKSEIKEYSVSEYCYNMLKKYSTDEYSEFRTLLVDLLNYGTESQIYTNYCIDNLVSDRLTDEQKGWGTMNEIELATVMDKEYVIIDNPLILWSGVRLKLEDSIEMRFRINAENVEDLKAKIVSDSGEAWYIYSEAFEKSSDGYYIYFDKLNAAQMSEPIYLTIYDGETPVSNTVCYSIESYAYSKQNDADEKLVNLVNAMMKYGNSAYAYIN